MRVLYKGLIGEDVSSWQTFLRGVNKTSKIFVNGIFDEFTKIETENFQTKLPNKLAADGVVGNQTYAKALKMGFGALTDERTDENSITWPTKPANAKQLTDVERTRIFGQFSYIAAPTSQNAEAIKITDNWPTKNIVSVKLPQLVNVKGAPKNLSVSFHKLGAEQLKAAFIEIEKAGLLNKVLTHGGTWVPRFIRGSTTKLSNHALGTAIDINVEWNALGTHGALKDEVGSVRELVMIFYKNGFYWGNWFARQDPMHFELFKVL